MVILNRLACGT